MSLVSGRRPTNVSLPARVVEEAKALGINLSRACENGLEAALRTERDRLWQFDNKDAVDYYNQWIADHGLPLDAFRQF